MNEVRNKEKTRKKKKKKMLHLFVGDPIQGATAKLPVC